MPSKLVRLTVDLHDPHVKVLEYGHIIKGQLTEDQVEEMEELEKVLSEFSDFASAADINDEKRKELMDKKMRYEELKLLKEDKIEWVPQDVTLLQSVLLMMQPKWIPIYSENIPGELLVKMLDPNLVVNIMPSGYPSEETVAQQPPHQQQPQQQQPQPEPIDNVTLVQEVLRGMEGSPKMSKHEGKTWLDLVGIGKTNPSQGQSTLSNTVYIMPVFFLKDDWQPIQDALKGYFGDKLDWTRDGKTSHWSVKF